MGTFNNEIKNVVLIAYMSKETGKIGTMRIAENNPETLTDLIRVMKDDICNLIWGMQLQRHELEEKNKNSKEIQEQIKYLKNLEIGILMLKEGTIVVGKKFTIISPDYEEVQEIINKRKHEQAMEEAEGITEEVTRRMIEKESKEVK